MYFYAQVPIEPVQQGRTATRWDVTPAAASESPAGHVGNHPDFRTSRLSGFRLVPMVDNSQEALLRAAAFAYLKQLADDGKPPVRQEELAAFTCNGQPV